jgi:hypothetical protein
MGDSVSTTVQSKVPHAYNKLQQILLFIKRPPKIEIQLQHAPIERTPESPPMAIFPRMPYDTERDIFIWRTGREND